MRYLNPSGARAARMSKGFGGANAIKIGMFGSGLRGSVSLARQVDEQSFANIAALTP